MQNTLSIKSTSLSFFLQVTNYCQARSVKNITVVLFLVVQISRGNIQFYPYKKGEIPTRKDKYPMLRKNMKYHQLIKHTKIPHFIAHLLFVRHLPKWSKPRYLKAEALQGPQKVRTVLV